jgi:hypothetical protein
MTYPNPTKPGQSGPNCIRFDSVSRLSGNLQIFELKQLADKEALYKAECRKALRRYKSWRREQAAQTDIIELLYGNLEGTLLRRRAEDMVKAYWIIRHDFRRAFKEYLQKSCCYPSVTPVAAA